MAATPENLSNENPEGRWEHFSHGADIGIRGLGPTKDAAFEAAAMAMTSAITDLERIKTRETVKISCRADDDEILFYDWINALVLEMSVRGLLFGEFDVHIEGPQLTATAAGEAVDVERHDPIVEVKGATFTELAVYRNDNGDWVAQCIIDV